MVHVGYADGLDLPLAAFGAPLGDVTPGDSKVGNAIIVGAATVGLLIVVGLIVREDLAAPTYAPAPQPRRRR